MKKKHLIIYALAFIISSCSSSSEELLSVKSELNSINVDIYKNNSLWFYSEYTFLENKLNTIKHSSGYSKQFSYDGGIVSNIDTYKDNILVYSDTFIFDELGRLTSTTNLYPNTQLGYKKDINYNEDNINTKVTWLDGAEQTNTISLKNNSIVNDYSPYSTDNYSITYINNNLTEIIGKHDNNENYNVKYNYLDIKASEHYQYEKNIFGIEWKNNFILKNQLNFSSAIDPYKISENLISDYEVTMILTATNSPSITIRKVASFEYEFDDNNRIIKQIENFSINSLDNFDKIITSYNYE